MPVFSIPLIKHNKRSLFTDTIVSENGLPTLLKAISYSVFLGKFFSTEKHYRAERLLSLW